MSRVRFISLYRGIFIFEILNVLLCRASVAELGVANQMQSHNGQSEHRTRKQAARSAGNASGFVQELHVICCENAAGFPVQSQSLKAKPIQSQNSFDTYWKISESRWKQSFHLFFTTLIAP